MKLTSYISRSGKKSGVTGYYSDREFIIVRFTNGKLYTYSYNSAGQETVEDMKLLALEQEGLSTYIAKNNPLFE